MLDLATCTGSKSYVSSTGKLFLIESWPSSTQLDPVMATFPIPWASSRTLGYGWKNTGQKLEKQKNKKMVEGEKRP